MIFLSVIFLLLLLASAGLILYARDCVDSALWRYRNPPENLAADHEAYCRRLQSPDWAFYTEHLQRTAPAQLVAWFADAAAVSKPDYHEDLYVVFSPIDRTAYVEEWVSPGVIGFAHSDGDPIFLQPGADSTDAVFMAFHDGGGVERIAPSVQAFLAALHDAI